LLWPRHSWCLRTRSASGLPPALTSSFSVSHSDVSTPSDCSRPPAEFAEALQHLEDEFYKAGVAKFSSSDFTNAGFSSSQLALEQITSIKNDEETHAGFLDVSAAPAAIRDLY
jgi:hypothetical protein